jgi:phosphoglucosamine mutase
MRRHAYNFGGEQSGHLIFLKHNTTGDGILGALQLLVAMNKKEQPLSELTQIMKPFPQVLKNVRTAEKTSVEEIPGFSARIASMEKNLGASGRILVRTSGTEPVIRVMVEGEDEELIDTMACELCDFISRLGGD